MGKLNIRKISKDEAFEVVNLLSEAIVKIKNKDYVSPIELDEIVDFFTLDTYHLFGTYEDDKLVAMAYLIELPRDCYENKLLKHFGAKTAMLCRYATLPEYRNLGIMTKLQKKLIEVAREMKFDYVVATAHPNNIASVKVITKDLQYKLTIDLPNLKRALYELDIRTNREIIEEPEEEEFVLPKVSVHTPTDDVSQKVIDYLKRPEFILKNYYSLQEWVKGVLITLFKEDMVSDDEINRLFDLDYCKATFDIQYPLFCTDSTKIFYAGHSRYWQRWKLEGKYYVCSQWWVDKFGIYEGKINSWIRKVVRFKFLNK